MPARPQKTPGNLHRDKGNDQPDDSELVSLLSEQEECLSKQIGKRLSFWKISTLGVKDAVYDSSVIRTNEYHLRILELSSKLEVMRATRVHEFKEMDAQYKSMQASFQGRVGGLRSTLRESCSSLKVLVSGRAREADLIHETELTTQNEVVRANRDIADLVAAFSKGLQEILHGISRRFPETGGGPSLSHGRSTT